MTTPTVYRWDDTSAPALYNNTAVADTGTLPTILKACLIDGYGSKAGLGWSEAFTVTDYRTDFVLRAGSGRRFYLKITQSDTADQPHIQKMGAACTAYESMTDKDTGVDSFAPSIGGANVMVSTTQDTTQRPWMVIADATAFYVIVWYSSLTTDAIDEGQAPCSVFFFGDFEASTSDNAWNTAIAGTHEYDSEFSGNSNVKAWFPGWLSAGANNRYTVGVARDEDGSNKSPDTQVFLPGPQVSLSPYPGGSQGFFSYPFRGQFMAAKPFIVTGSYSEAGYPRGYFPGLVVPFHSAPLSNLATITKDSDTYIAVCPAGVTDGELNTLGQILINQTEWRV